MSGQPAPYGHTPRAVRRHGGDRSLVLAIEQEVSAVLGDDTVRGADRERIQDLAGDLSVELREYLEEGLVVGLDEGLRQVRALYRLAVRRHADVGRVGAVWWY